MKINLTNTLQQGSTSRAGTRAFTLSEMIVATAIFLLLVTALVSVQLFGLRMFSISETKLSATTEARKALNRIYDEVRSAKTIYVGNGSSNAFNLVADNSPQIGNALKLYPGTDTNTYVYYYLDPQQGDLYRMTSGNPAIEVMASGITNQLMFQAENFQGMVLTNSQNNRVIKASIQIYQRELASAAAANGGLYDSYQLQTRIAKRSID